MTHVNFLIHRILVSEKQTGIWTDRQTRQICNIYIYIYIYNNIFSMRNIFKMKEKEKEMRMKVRFINIYLQFHNSYSPNTINIWY